MKVQEALKAAIEAMELANISCEHFHHEKKHQHLYGEKCIPEDMWKDALCLCKSALSDIEKCEPVGWQFYQDGKWHNGMETNNHKQNTIDAGLPVRELYTSPISKEWLVIDEETIDDIGNTLSDEQGFIPVETWTEFARAIEAKLKQLNAGKG